MSQCLSRLSSIIEEVNACDIGCMQVPASCSAGDLNIQQSGFAMVTSKYQQRNKTKKEHVRLGISTDCRICPIGFRI